MNDIVLTFVFSIVMLIFMIYPAMKITDLIAAKMPINETKHNIITVLLTVGLSVAIGFFLRFG